MPVKYYFFVKLIQQINAMKLSKQDCQENYIYFPEKFLTKLYKKEDPLFETFKMTLMVKSGNFQKEFKVYQRENLRLLEKHKCSWKNKKNIYI